MLRPAALLAALTVLVVSPRVAADETAADEQAARAFAEAQALYRRGEYGRAVELFLQSQRLHPHFLTLCNLARCHERQADPLRATQYYRRCLADGGASSPQAGQINAALRAVEARLARVTVKTPPGAEGIAWVDGAELGRAPIELALNPGRHRIELRDGPTISALDLRVSEGERRTVVLGRAPPEAVTSRPAGDDAPDEDRPAPRRRLRPLWFWGAVGLTAALAAATAALGALTLKANRDYEASPSQARFDAVIARRNQTNLLLGLAGGAAAAGTTLFFFTRFGSRGDQLPDDRAALLVWRGSF